MFYYVLDIPCSGMMKTLSYRPCGLNHGSQYFQFKKKLTFLLNTFNVALQKYANGRSFAKIIGLLC